MTRQERLSELAGLIVEKGSVHVDEIVATLGISAATVRRDLDVLAEQQLITRIRGGAVANTITGELPMRYRSSRQSPEKSRIAKSIAERIEPGQVVALNGGTTTTAVAHEIGITVAAREEFAATGITVVTNAVNIANDLTVRPQVRVVLTGGVARARSYELAGPLATLILPHINIDLLVLGASAVDTTDGIFSTDEDEARMNHEFAQRARKTIVAADHTKFTTTAFAKICGWDEIDEVVTNKTINAASKTALEEQKVKVTTV